MDRLIHFIQMTNTINEKQGVGHVDGFKSWLQLITTWVNLLLGIVLALMYVQHLWWPTSFYFDCLVCR